MKQIPKLFTLIFIVLSSHLFAQNNTPKQVYQFELNDEIAKPAWLKVQKAIKESSMMKSDIVILKLNTYGGLLEMADSIRTAILNAKIPFWVFIDNNAASAGALISIACDSIYMREGANIGAATVVNQTGEQLPDKYQSYMRSLMRSTAEATHRNPDIAQAMVDPRIHVQGVNDSGQVVTFTASEALKHGFCNAKAENIKDVLKVAGITNYIIHEQKLSTTDKIIGFLTKSFVSGILIMIIIGGIYLEFQSPGAILPIVAAAIAALLYFAPHYLEGLAANWEILIFVIGVVLLMVEIFVIPGFGVAGITGIFLMVMGLTLAMIDNINFTFTQTAGSKILESFFIVIIASFLALVGAFYLTKKLFSGHTIFGNLALVETQQKEAGYSSANSEYSALIGKQGVAYSMLRPSGKIIIQDVTYDATALVGYIEKGEPIEVVDYTQAQLVVVKTKTPKHH